MSNNATRFDLIFFLHVWRVDSIPGHGLPYGASRSHSLDTQHSVGLLWRRDQPEAEITICLTTHSNCKSQTSILPVGFEPEIRTSERHRTHALDRSATRFGRHKLDDLIYIDTYCSVRQTLCKV